MLPFVKFRLPTKFIFFNPTGEQNQPFRFSSDLEKVGTEWDVSLRNGSYVEPVSEPVDISRPQYGGIISVIKVKADVATDFHTIIKEFWIPTIALVPLEQSNHETQN